MNFWAGGSQQGREVKREAMILVVKSILLKVLIGFAILSSSAFFLPERGMAEKGTEKGISIQTGEFQPTEDLEGRVHFWRLIFTKYGQHQLVFHYRSHPEIVYSVLDFSEYASESKGRSYEKVKANATREEVGRIRQALKNLANGAPPSNSFERRIKRLFEDHVGSARSAFQAALHEEEIRSQTGIRERFREGVKLSGRYLGAIEQIFQDAGLPTEIARLPLVESSFNYQAYSSKGAAGIWQFMRSTGKVYGMKISPSIDERRDPIVASRAAAKYLSNAYNRLGSWPLAISSYNHGLSGILRAAKQTGSRDLGTIIKRYRSESFGFASSNFYTSFLAALEVEQNYRLYFPDLVRDDAWEFDEISLQRPVGYQTLVKFADVSEDQFHEYNLALMDPIRKGRALVPAGYLVRVPAGHGVKLANALRSPEALKVAKSPVRDPESGGPSDGHSVQAGETIASIARHYGVSQQQLLAFNGNPNPKKIRVGKKLKIPNNSAQESVGVEVKKPGRGGQASDNARIYTVKSGDTIAKIARKLKTTVSALQMANPQASGKIYPGDKISY